MKPAAHCTEEQTEAGGGRASGSALLVLLPPPVSRHWAQSLSYTVPLGQRDHPPSVSSPRPKRSGNDSNGHPGPSPVCASRLQASAARPPSLLPLSRRGNRGSAGLNAPPGPAGEAGRESNPGG